MYQILKISGGQIELLNMVSEPDRARDACKGLSATQDAVFAVRREGYTRVMYFAYRGKLGEPLDIMARMTVQNVPPVLTLEKPLTEDGIMPDYNKLTTAELRKLAREREIAGHSAMKRANLIAALNEADRHTPPGPTEFKSRTGQPSEFKIFPATLISSDPEQGIVEAIVNVFGVVDDGDDMVHPNAFVKTLSERGNRVKVLDSHNSRSALSVVGKPLEIREVGRDELPLDVLTRYPEATGGLYTRTQYLMSTPEGRGIFERIASGAVDEYSIGFDAVDVDNSRIETPTGEKRVVRNIRQVRLWEYSPVIWGMNPATATVSVKDAAGDPTPNAEKEMTPDGPVRRLGDYLIGEALNVIGAMVNGFLSDGFLDNEEHALLTALMSRHVDAIRSGIPEDVALRDLASGFDWMMFFDREPPAYQKESAPALRGDIDLTAVHQHLTAALTALTSGQPLPDTSEEHDGQHPSTTAPTLEEAGPPDEAAPDDAALLARIATLTAELEALNDDPQGKD